MADRGKQVRIKQKILKRLKETKEQSQKKFKTYSDVINYLYMIRDKYFKLKNKI